MSRQALVDRLLRDPPLVHAMDFSDDPEVGVWSTDPDCYALLASEAGPGTRTLETGSGLSTVLFAALGASHTCVTPSRLEADRILDYCRTRDINASTLTFLFGMSDAVLPGMTDDLDLVLLDGSHGFPTPVLDWYFAGGRLVDGGLLVVDDIQLPAVAQLLGVLDRDPRWCPARRSGKWAAWRRIGSGSLAQDWFEQPWFVLPRPLHERVAGRLRREARRLGGRGSA